MRYKALLDEATTLAKRRDFGRSESLLREILDAQPKNVPALDLLGYVLYFQDRATDAEAICRQTLELKPGHAYALKGLGLCVAKRGRIDEAVETIEAAIAAKPDWFDPYWDLCVTLVEAGRYADACGVMKRAREAIPARAGDWDRMERHARTMGARQLQKNPDLPDGKS
jgi:Flp pilus assembly protein TadD